jgi:uncharacterized protein (DUF305 family)
MYRRFTTSLSCLALAVGLVCAVAPLTLAHEQTTTEAAANPAETAFLAENDTAMAKMMNDMAIKPTGDIDRDFTLMMIPHHQGAVDMALAQLRYGKNEQLRRIAQEIVVEQMQEINAMRMAIGEPLPPSTPAPTQQPQPVTAPAPAAAEPLSQHHRASPTQ